MAKINSKEGQTVSPIAKTSPAKHTKKSPFAKLNSRKNIGAKLGENNIKGCFVK